MFTRYSKKNDRMVNCYTKIEIAEILQKIKWPNSKIKELLTRMNDKGNDWEDVNLALIDMGFDSAEIANLFIKSGF